MKKKKLFIILIAISALVSVIIVFFYTSKNESVKTETREKYKIEGKVNFISSASGDKLSTLWVELADTPYEHSKGMMYRLYMPDTVGMLFIYPDSEERSYWMQNTRLSLDIIYVDENFNIISAYKYAVPYSEEGMPSHGPCKYVIETNAGYMDENGIVIGDRIRIRK